MKSFNSDSQYIQSVLADPDFPKKGSMANKVEGDFYVENGKAYSNFTSSEGRAMRYYFYFGVYNMDGKYTVGDKIRGDFYQLFYGTEFVA